jgi:hypothetical protein
VIQNKLLEAFARGIGHFNRREFFEAHEVWEEIWRATPGPEREVYQGLIQLAVACLHLTRGNVAGAEYEVVRAREHLASFMPSALGIDLAALLKQVEACVAQRAVQDLPVIRREVS